MAKPIKETPFLSGSDAEKFIKENKTVVKISSQEREQIKDNYEALNSIFHIEA